MTKLGSVYFFSCFKQLKLMIFKKKVLLIKIRQEVLKLSLFLNVDKSGSYLNFLCHPVAVRDKRFV